MARTTSDPVDIRVQMEAILKSLQNKLEVARTDDTSDLVDSLVQMVAEIRELVRNDRRLLPLRAGVQD